MPAMCQSVWRRWMRYEPCRAGSCRKLCYWSTVFRNKMSVSPKLVLIGTHNQRWLKKQEERKFEI